MKHKIGILMVTLTVLLIVFTMAVSAESCDITGDLNHDGFVNNNDIDVARNMVSGKDAPSQCADLDGDGIVQTGDIVMLKNIIIENSRNNVTYDKDYVVNHQPENYTVGDTNADGKLDYQDIGIIKDMIAGKITPHPSGDLDGDGIVQTGDLVQSKNIAFGLQAGPINMHTTYEPGNESNDTSNGTNETGNETVSNQTDSNSTNSTNDTNQTADENVTVGNSTDNSTVEAPAYTYQLPSNPLCSGLTGDLNKDGVIDELDFEVIKNMIAGKETPDICGDLDGDGYVAPGDYAKLKVTVLMDIPRWNITFTPRNFNDGRQCTVYGDINNDGKISYQDVDIIKKMIAGIIAPAESADIDGDGYISPGDMVPLKNKAFGLPYNFARAYSGNCSYLFPNNDTNSTGNETGDDDQGDDNDNQGNETGNNNNSTNSTKKHKSTGGRGSSGSSSTGGTAVFSVYNQPNENVTDEQPAANATVVIAEKAENTTTEKQEDEKIPEAAIVAENQENSYKPSIWMLGAIIALVVASLGMTGIYIGKALRKKKAYA